MSSGAGVPPFTGARSAARDTVLGYKPSTGPPAGTAASCAVRRRRRRRNTTGSSSTASAPSRLAVRPMPAHTHRLLTRLPARSCPQPSHRRGNLRPHQLRRCHPQPGRLHPHSDERVLGEGTPPARGLLPSLQDAVAVRASPFNWYIQPSPAQLLRVCVAVAFRRAVLRLAYWLLRGKDLDTGRVIPTGAPRSSRSSRPLRNGCST